MEGLKGIGSGADQGPDGAVFHETGAGILSEMEAAVGGGTPNTAGGEVYIG